MCVLLPVSSQSPPSGTAVDFIALNDDPAPFSLMHSEKTASPVAMPRSHRSFCSAVPQSSSHRCPCAASCPVTSPCRPTSSLITAYSATPPPRPPYSVGTSGPRSRYSSRGKRLARLAVSSSRRCSSPNAASSAMVFLIQAALVVSVCNVGYISPPCRGGTTTTSAGRVRSRPRGPRLPRRLPCDEALPPARGPAPDPPPDGRRFARRLGAGL